MIEYNEHNRFPFHAGNKSIAVCEENHEDKYEMDFIFTKVVERFPTLDPKPFYLEIEKIQTMRENDRTKQLKAVTDRLFSQIKFCFTDEGFVHYLYDKWGIGIDKLIETLYAVYGYYFYTGKRTANALKKIIDGYAIKPVH